MNNFLSLNIPTDSFLNSHVTGEYLSGIRSNTIMTYIPAEKIIQKDVLYQLTSFLGQRFSNCILFSTGPNYELNIHKDTGNVNVGGERLTTWSLNYVINSEKHDMIWYKENDGYQSIRIVNSLGSEYYHIEPENVQEIERASLNGLTLVRTDIPHNVINHDPYNIRYCISLRAPFSKMSWEEAYLKFSKFNYVTA